MRPWFSPEGILDPQAGGMRYRDFDIGNPECIHAVLSSRAYGAIIAQTLAGAPGGVLAGNVCSRIWYASEASGAPGDFPWTEASLEALAPVNGGLYRYPQEVLGLWRRNPGSREDLAPEEGEALRELLRDRPHGLLVVTVNLDPDLRMTFWHCCGETVMPVEYDHGDEYFLEELLEYAPAETLAARSPRKGVRVRPHRYMDPEQMPRRLEVPAQEPPPVQEELPVQKRPPEAPPKQEPPPEAPAESLEAAVAQKASEAALARELMRRLEEAMDRMPSAYMVRLRDQNDQILAMLEQLLRTPEPVPPPLPRVGVLRLETPPEEVRRVPERRRLELPEETGEEVSGRINDLRVKYATEGGKRGWGV